jgi:hypothetical protein
MMADNTGHGLVSTGKEKSWSPRYDKCLYYGRDYVEMQWAEVQLSVNCFL